MDGEQARKDRAFEFAAKVAQDRQSRIPEFERVAMMSDRDRIEAMKDWSEEKRRQYYARFARKARRHIDLSSMVDRKMAKVGGGGQSSWIRLPCIVAF